MPVNFHIGASETAFNMYGRASWPSQGEARKLAQRVEEAQAILKDRATDDVYEAGGAGRFAEAVQATSSGRGGSSDSGGASVFGDRQHVAASNRFTAEVQARAAANFNASEASSLLQTADEALKSIRNKHSRR